MNPDFHHSLSVVRQGIAEGLHPGAQLYISLHNQVLLDTSIGEARPGVPMTPDSLNLWFSSTKPIAAIAIAQLWERGLLELDDPAVRFIPEFGQNGKESITLRHLLTHTAGFRTPPRSEKEPWDKIIAEMCAARQETGWTPGQKAGYHVASSWYILAEIIRRLDGRPYSRYVRDAIFQPLGMKDSWIGMTSEAFLAYGSRIALMQDTTKSPAEPLDMESIATTCRPGSGGFGPIRELGKLYEMLLRRGRIEESVLSPQSVEALTARHRAGMFDATFKAQMDWGLGFLLNSPQPQEELPYGYGPRASPRAFGHGGAQSSGAFCDPESGLVVAYVFNGRPGEAKHNERRKGLMLAIRDDLNDGSIPHA